jgi:hypothetical protein
MALRICRFWLLALALAWTPWVLAAAAGGQVAGSPWSALSAPQREALAPLAA